MFQIATYNEYNITLFDFRSHTYETLVRLSNETLPDHSFQNMSNSQWIQAYNTEFVSDHGDLFLAIDRLAFDTSSLSSIPSNISFFLPINIEKGNQKIISNLTAESSEWIRYNYSTSPKAGSGDSVSMHVKQAFAKTISPLSRIQISLYFMVTVIALNLLKLAIMLWVLFTDKHEYIVTQGDALVTFLKRPDLATRGKCTYGKEEMLYHLGHVPYYPKREEKTMGDRWTDRLAGTWLPQNRPYFDSVTYDRQIFFALL